MRSVIVILKREMRSYFLSPVAYAVMVIFAIISGYFFYSGMVFYGMASFEASRMAQYMGQQELDMASFVLRPLFGNMGVVMLLLAPLVTMRMFSEEMKSGSIELLLTWPVTGLQLTLGKYLAALGLFAAMTGVTIVYAGFASIYAPVAWGAVAAACLGLLLLAACFVALGMFVSTLTENQIISAAVSFGSLLMLWVISWTAGNDSGPLAETLRHISILEHMETFAKGVIDTKDVVYYLSFIFLFVFLTLRSLESRSWRGERRMKQRLKKAAGGTAFTVIVIAIVAMVNIIAAGHSKRFDLSADRRFSLTPEAVSALSALGGQIKVYAFIKPEKTQETKDILEQFAYRSKLFGYEIVDPDRKPGVAKKYNVAEYDTFIVEAASGKRESARGLTEEGIINAIARVTAAGQKKIYVLKGHGERDVAQDGPGGWTEAKNALEAAGYIVAGLNLFQAGKVPEDADLLIIPGPAKDIQPAEALALETAVKAGKPALFMVDPGRLPNVEKLLSGFGFALRDDMIVDPLSQQLGFDPLVAAVAEFGAHPAAANMKAVVLFPLARSLETGKGVNNAHMDIIAATTQKSWGETDAASIEKGKPVFDSTKDHPGPLAIIASAEWESGPPKEERKIGGKVPKTRMAVAGDSDFTTNASVNFSGARDLFLDTVNWLAERENNVTIKARHKKFNPVFFTPGQLAAVFWVTVVMIPAAVTGGGIYVWRRRRG